MGVFSRKDSPYWWAYLEPTREKLRLNVRVGKTPAALRMSRDAAIAQYGRLLVEATPSLGPPSTTFGTLAAEYRATVIPLRRGADRESEILKQFERAFGDLPLRDLTRERVRAWMVQRVKQAKPSTVNREVDLLKSVLREAVPRYLSVSPLAGMPRIPSAPPRRRILTHDEEARLLAAAADDPYDYALLVLGIDTLIRLGDLLDLRRSDRQGDWLYVAHAKNGRAFEVPLSPRAAAALDAVPDEGRPHYFWKFRLAMEPRDWRGCVRKRMERLFHRAGVPFGRNGGVTFHWATRSTGTTRLVIDRNVPVPVVQRIGGWSRPDVPLAVYVAAHRDDLARAVGQGIIDPEKRKSDLNRPETGEGEAFAMRRSGVRSSCGPPNPKKIDESA